MGLTSELRRHPAEVTADRLMEAISRWGDKLSQQERDYISVITHALDQIAQGDR